jgi:hypothetical protein
MSETIKTTPFIFHNIFYVTVSTEWKKLMSPVTLACSVCPICKIKPTIKYEFTQHVHSHLIADVY